MIPDFISDRTESAGEPYVFSILRDSPMTESWTVFHSLDLPVHISRISGEIDFVIMIPALGILCLEVKGHSRIERRGGSWYFGNSPIPDSRGPFKQASEAAHSFRGELARRLPALARVPVWSCVAMPFGHLEDSSSEWHSWQLLQRRDSDASILPTRLRHSLEQGIELFRRKFHIGRDGGYPFLQSDVEQIVKQFRGDFEVLMSPKDRQAAREEELKRFTDEQYLIIDGLTDSHRAIITGPAGTGKTCMAIEESRRCKREMKVLFVCFNALLSEHLSQELVDRPNIKVTTISKLLLDHVPKEYLPLSRDAHFWDEVLPTLFEDAFLRNGASWQKYGILVIDEAQDVARPKFLAALELLLEGGLKNGRWRMFGDPERQAIYGAAPQLDSENMPGHPAIFSIRINCRNTPRISKYAEMLGSLKPGYRRVRRPDNKIDPSLIYYKDAEDQIRRVIQALDQAYRDGSKGENIVLLSPRSEGSLATRLPSPWKDRLTPAKGAKRGHIRFCTIHAFKGLDAPIVLLTDLDPVSLRTTEAIFYIGITRALHQLSIFVDETARGVILNLLISKS